MDAKKLDFHFYWSVVGATILDIHFYFGWTIGVARWLGSTFGCKRIIGKSVYDLAVVSVVYCRVLSILLYWMIFDCVVVGTIYY